MISKPPATADRGLNIWNQEVAREVNNYLRSLVIPVSPLGTGAALLHGKHSSMQLQVGETAYFEVIIPWFARKIKEATIRFIPTTTGTIDWTANLSYGGVGEDENTSTSTATADGLAVTDDQVMEINLSYPTNCFAAVDGGDQVGIELVLDAAATTTDIHVLSLFIKYF